MLYEVITYKFYNGIILFFTKYSASSLFTILPLLGFLILAMIKKKSLEPLQKILIIFSIVYFVLYSFLNVPPYHWYYIPIIFSTILLFSLAFTEKIADEFRDLRGLNKLVIFLLTILFFSLGLVKYFNQYNFNTPQEARITSYNVCYTKLLRIELINNDGVIKKPDKPAIINPDKSAKVNLQPRIPVQVKMLLML